MKRVITSGKAAIACAVVGAAALAACAEKPLPASPLPPLVEDTPRDPVAISVDAPLVLPGERLAWDVSWRGLSVGRLQLATRRQADTAPGAPPAIAVRSELHLHGLAARVASVRHDVTTVVARTATSGQRVHDVHSAFAIVRAWSRRSSPPGYLMVRFRDQLYRVDLATPRQESSELRVDGRVVRAVGRQQVAFSFSLWLSAEPDRVPRRIEAEHDGDHIVAELIERSL